MSSVNLQNVIAGLATTAVVNVADDPSTRVTRADAPVIADAIRTQVAADPVINQIADAVTPVHWYQDRIFMTSIVGVIASILATVWGIQLTPEHQALLVNILPSVIGTLAGLAVIVFRFFSRVKPIIK